MARGPIVASGQFLSGPEMIQYSICFPILFYSFLSEVFNFYVYAKKTHSEIDIPLINKKTYIYISNETSDQIT